MIIMIHVSVALLYWPDCPNPRPIFATSQIEWVGLIFQERFVLPKIYFKLWPHHTLALMLLSWAAQPTNYIFERLKGELRIQKGIPKMKLDFQNMNWECRSLKNRKICTPNLKLHNWFCIVFSVSLVTSKIFGKRPWTDVMNDNHAMHFVDFSSHWLTLHNGFKPFLKSMFNFYTYGFVQAVLRLNGSLKTWFSKKHSIVW